MVGVDVELRLAGVEHGSSRGGRCRLSEDLESFFDLGSPCGEAVQHLGGDAVDFGAASLHRCPGDAERVGELVAEFGLVEVAGGAGVSVEVAAVEGAPPAIDPLHHVRDQHMGV